jgi:hypothetical protein
MWHMQQSIVEREAKRLFPRRQRRVSRRNSFNYAMFNMRKLTTTEHKFAMSQKVRIKEGNEQLTAARMNCIVARKDSRLDLLFNLHKAQRTSREQLQGICFVFVATET